MKTIKRNHKKTLKNHEKTENEIKTANNQNEMKTI